MLCVRTMTALCAVLVLIGMAGCASNRVETMKIEPTALTLNTKAPVSPFTVTAYNAKGEVLPAPVIMWSSSDSLTLAVDQTGKLTPFKSGVATISAASGNAKVAASVTVALFTSIDLPDTALQLAVGEAKGLSARILDENGNAVAGVITWESTDRAVADVSAEGLLTALAPGEAQISANVQGLGSKSVPVTVAEPAARKPGR